MSVGEAAQGGVWGREPDTDANAGAHPRSFGIDWAKSPEDIAEAQRLRFKVFVGEMGARLQTPADSPVDHDIDVFDSFCDHLLVRAAGAAQHGEVVATCRVLSPDGARRAGSLYTEHEFDLASVSDLLPHSLELGRVCVDPAWRNGFVVMAIWRELGKQMADQHLDTLIGCSSITLRDGDDTAARLWHRLKRTHLVAHGRQVRPWIALAMAADDEDLPVAVPALLKGYLRCGSKLLGPPAIDTAFNTADFPMLMRLSDLPSRYGKRIFGA
ncbi:MAG: GNAT family N-acyltransferase [Betaproteobacteria bacterium]